MFIAPTAETFKARFPEFESVGAMLIDLVLVEAEGSVPNTWNENDRAPAILYLTAHKLALQGEPARSQGTSYGASAMTGPVKSRKVGDVSIEFAGVSGGGSGAGGKSSLYDATFYGQQFLAYLRRNFHVIAVV